MIVNLIFLKMKNLLFFTLLILIILSWSFLNISAYAQIPSESPGKCYINGQEVPCEQVGQLAKNIFSIFGVAGMIFGILIFVIIILSFVFWLWMLIDVIKNPIENKVLWIIVLIIGGLLGAIIYFAVVKIHRHKEEAKTN